MSAKYCYKNQIESFINEDKRYLLTEIGMTNDELRENKMFPRLSKEQLSKMNNKETYLGRKLKEGDMVFFAFIQDRVLEEGMPTINFRPVMLTEDEFDFYKVVRDDCTGNGVPVLEPIQ
jgi:hypothetical protein